MDLRKFRCAALPCLLLCLLLAGCASGPQHRAFDKTANAGLKTIEILPMRHSEIDLVIVNNPGYSFGLIGFAIAEANRAPKADWLREQVRIAGFDHLTSFRQALDSVASQAGYELLWPEPVMESEDAKTRRDPFGFRKTYQSSQSNAQLDINFGFVGYASAGATDNAPYRPTVVLNAKLVDASGRQNLFEDQIIYNAVTGNQSQSITINPDERYRYPDFDDLKAAGPEAIEGLAPAFTAVAQELARQLQR